MQWQQLDHMQTVCTLLQTEHLITQFLQARCSSWRPTNSVEALKTNFKKPKTPKTAITLIKLNAKPYQNEIS